MAYNAVAQVDQEVASDSGSDDFTPAASRAFQSLRDHGHLAAQPQESALTDEPRGLAQLGSMLKGHGVRYGNDDIRQCDHIFCKGSVGAYACNNTKKRHSVRGQDEPFARKSNSLP